MCGDGWRKVGMPALVAARQFFAPAVVRLGAGDAARNQMKRAAAVSMSNGAGSEASHRHWPSRDIFISASKVAVHVC